MIFWAIFIFILVLVIGFAVPFRYGIKGTVSLILVEALTILFVTNLDIVQDAIGTRFVPEIQMFPVYIFVFMNNIVGWGLVAIGGLLPRQRLAVEKNRRAEEESK